MSHQTHPSFLSKFNKRAFTLIELLVVIAIIAILAAILFPVFGRARENARRSSCQSNLKQIALGVFQYTQDYDEKFPTYYNAVAYTLAKPYAWADEIQPYIKSLQLYQCPSESTPPPTPVDQADAAGYIDYGINLALTYGDNVGGGTAGADGAKNMSVLTQPAITVMMFDYFPINTTAAISAGCSPRPCTAGLATFPPPSASFSPTGFRHLEGMNYSFTDGHVKWFKSQNDTTSASVYNNAATGTGSSPTFNIVP